MLLLSVKLTLWNLFLYETKTIFGIIPNQSGVCPYLIGNQCCILKCYLYTYIGEGCKMEDVKYIFT